MEGNLLRKTITGEPRDTERGCWKSALENKGTRWQPTLPYEQGDHTQQAVLGLKIEAKHKGDLVWKLQLEVAGFYTLEGFSEEQQKDILHGYCMNQLYSHAAVIATQMVTQGGFVPIYLQPMDFNKMYQQRKKEVLENVNNQVPSETLSDRLNAVLEINVSETLLN